MKGFPGVILKFHPTKPCLPTFPSISRSWPWLPINVLERKGAKSIMISLREPSEVRRGQYCYTDLSRGHTVPRATSSFCVSMASLLGVGTGSGRSLAKGLMSSSSGRGLGCAVEPTLWKVEED